MKSLGGIRSLGQRIPPRADGMWGTGTHSLQDSPAPSNRILLQGLHEPGGAQIRESGLFWELSSLHGTISEFPKQQSWEGRSSAGLGNPAVMGVGELRELRLPNSPGRLRTAGQLEHT